MEKWNRLFTDDVEVPQIAMNKVEEAFAQIRRESGEKMVKSKELNMKEGILKRKWKAMGVCSKVAAIAGMVLVIGSGSVFAASRVFSIKDFIQNIPKDAEKYIDRDVSVDNTKDNIQNTDKNYVVSDDMLEELKNKVSFRVKETVSDGTSCHISVEATLSDPEHYLLVPEEFDMTEEGTFASVYYKDANKGESLEDYASRQRKQILMVESSLCLDDNKQEKYLESISGIVEDDSHVLLHISLSGEKKAVGFADGTKIKINNRASLYVNDHRTLWSEFKNENTTITLKNVATEEESVSYALKNGKEMRVGDSSVIIKSIILTNTPLETKVKLLVVNEDKELGNWIGVNLIDDEGNIFERGTSSGGSASKPDADGQFTYHTSYKKMKFPDHVNVRVRNLDTDEIYNLINIPVVK